MNKYRHPRRQAREAVFQAMYAREISGDDDKKILRDIIFRYSFNKETVEFVSDLYTNTVKQTEWIKNTISRHLKNWQIHRIALLDRLILQMAVGELYFMDDVPHKVSISEAIEIARYYSTEESSGFVNGILDAVYKEIKKNSKQ
ncbi:MAG: transcription antitermination factor NusB [Candidatus Marinimicrobia bacterium]|nr:transcription antitermination factor NusB [Candidatus Neomarinimicrobiota bacterium]MBL7060062.1 transcription antitermination factor NusB [Candidatus Neomarinimicrobiota bacterium]